MVNVHRTGYLLLNKVLSLHKFCIAYSLWLAFSAASGYETHWPRKRSIKRTMCATHGKNVVIFRKIFLKFKSLISRNTNLCWPFQEITSILDVPFLKYKWKYPFWYLRKNILPSELKFTFSRLEQIFQLKENVHFMTMEAFKKDWLCLRETLDYKWILFWWFKFFRTHRRMNRTIESVALVWALAGTVRLLPVWIIQCADEFGSFKNGFICNCKYTNHHPLWILIGGLNSIPSHTISSHPNALQLIRMSVNWTRISLKPFDISLSLPLCV